MLIAHLDENKKEAEMLVAPQILSSILSTFTTGLFVNKTKNYSMVNSMRKGMRRKLNMVEMFMTLMGIKIR